MPGTSCRAERPNRGCSTRAGFRSLGSLRPPEPFRRGVPEGRAMARPYAADLRDRVLLACERGGLSRSRIAELFGVGESTPYRWRQAWRTEGRREAKPPAGGPAPRLDEAALGRLEELVVESNDRTL